MLVSRVDPDDASSTTAPSSELVTSAAETVLGMLELRPRLCHELCGECTAYGPILLEEIELAIAEDGTIRDWDAPCSDMPWERTTHQRK